MTKVNQKMEISKMQPGGELQDVNFGTKELQVLFQAGIIPDKTPVEQVKVFARVCAEKGLSPFSKQIYLVNYAGRYSIITGIDGFRSLAGRTGLYAGSEPPMYNRTATGQWMTASDLVAAGKKMPVSCSFTVYKIVGGQRVAFTAECLFDEYAGRGQKGILTGKWATMPFNMIAKCAEAKAYKMAFPEQLSGMNIPEEQAAWEDTNTGMVSEHVFETEEEYNEEMERIQAEIAEIADLDGLKQWYQENPLLVRDQRVIELLTARKNELRNG